MSKQYQSPFVPITIEAHNIAMAMEAEMAMAMNPPVPNALNPALPPGEPPIDSDDDVELIDYNDGLGPEEIAAIEAAKIQATKVALRDSLASNQWPRHEESAQRRHHERLLCVATGNDGDVY